MCFRVDIRVDIRVESIRVDIRIDIRVDMLAACASESICSMCFRASERVMTRVGRNRIYAPYTG